MKIVFYTNFINHHQSVWSDELYRLLDGDFRLVETMPMFEWLKSSGYSDFSSRPYVIQVWKDNKSRKIAEELSATADVAIFGADSLDYEIIRAKYGKLSFEVSERWLKKGLLNLLSPRLLRNMWYYHTLFHNKPVYKLCSSAFAAGDQYKMFSFRDRCYKWGYFTKVDDYDIEQSLDARGNSEMRLMWCARFIKWKHPELAVKLAYRLKEKGYKFTLDMYGSGDELERTKDLVRKLDLVDVVKFCGNLPNEQILDQMRQHDIFLFTSDRNEGWGAVANEAMSNGCVLVGSDAIGCVPFLIRDGENGCVFKSGNQDSLLEKVEHLFNNPIGMRKMAINGYYTLRDFWSPENAAKNLLKLIEDLQNGRDASIADGPCSKALPL